MTGGKGKTLMRSFGQFVGHIVHAARTDVDATGSARQVLHRDVEQQEGVVGGAKVTLRRTTIEELECTPIDRADHLESDS